MPDLFTLLVADFIEENRSPERDPLTSDERLQWMEERLSDREQHEAAAGQERDLLLGYLELGDDELQSLPPAVHEWFLERWAISGPWTEDPKELGSIADRLTQTYFAAGPGSYQFACINALLVFDERNPRETQTSYLSGIWDRILDDPHLPEDAKREALLPLIDALLDLTRLAVESRAPWSALRALSRRDRDSYRFVAEVTAARAALLGEPHAGELLDLLKREEPEGRF
jgi:hypothetical protein